MLHEVLLALAGHPSPVLDGSGETGSFPLLTPAESALLSSLARLATLHRALKSHLPRVSAYHPSLICRALATAISSTHLASLQKLILETERQILAKDSAIVGAYDIVPLATIVTKFEPWKRKLDWYWEMACLMYSADAEPLSASSTDVSSSAACTGPFILNRLWQETKTGYPDIQDAALALLAVGEHAWLRQLSNWLMHNSAAHPGTWDFFVVNPQESLSSTRKTANRKIAPELVPRFVTSDTAQSIVFIGQTIQMLRSNDRRTTELSLPSALSDLHLNPYTNKIPLDFLQSLANLPSPIMPAALSSLISSLRSHVAAAVVDQILPVDHLLNTLGLLKQFFLAGRNDFIDLLIAEADRHIALRHVQSVRGLQQSDIGDHFVGVVMKDAEVSTILSKTWAAIAPSISKDVAAPAIEEEETIEWARNHLQLKIIQQPSENSDAFANFLLHTPIHLSARLESAFDLFLGVEDVGLYSSIHSYLMAIRRAHNHLSNLWRQTQFRRDHPAPIRRGRASKAFPIIRKKRRKALSRMQMMRDTWATCSTAVCMLAALGEYLVTEVVGQSWNKFHGWATQTGGEKGRNKPDAGSSIRKELPRDPELIVQGHQQYMEALVESLLLSDTRYVSLLKSLLEQVEQLVALVKRLGDVQRSIDLHDEGVLEGPARARLDADEHDISVQLKHACSSLGQSLVKLKEHLRGVSLESGSHQTARHLSTGFEAYSTANGLDRLLLRLEARPIEQEEDDGIDRD